MNNATLFISLLLVSVFTLHAQEPTPATEAGEDFDLSGVLSVMETAEDLSDLEKKINESENEINNLDLNKDDEIDIVKIVEYDENNTRVLALRAVLGENDFQDIASIEIEKHSDTEISLQIIGDPDLYGPDYILEPASEDSNTGDQGGGDSYFEPIEIAKTLTAAVFVSVHRWRPIGPLFRVGRVAFVSAVVWRPVPIWFIVRRPIARSTWRARSRRYSRNRYRSSKNRHSRNASRVYSNNRKKSSTAKKNVGPKPTSNNTAAKASKNSSKSTGSSGNQVKQTSKNTTTSYSKQQNNKTTAKSSSPQKKSGVKPTPQLKKKN